MLIKEFTDHLGSYKGTGGGEEKGVEGAGMDDHSTPPPPLKYLVILRTHFLDIVSEAARSQGWPAQKLV